MSNITGRLIKGSAWLSVARAIVNGLATLSTFVLARYLAPADFGLVAVGTTLLLILTTITELSLEQALIRHQAPTESHFNAAWTLNVMRGLSIWIFLAACAYPAAALYAEPRLVGVMVALGLSVFIGSMKNPRLVILQRDLIFWQEFALSVSQKFAEFAVAATIAVLYRTYWALVIGTLVSQTTSVITSYFVLPCRPRVTFRHFREFFSFAGWLAASQVTNTLNWRFDSLLIGKVLGGAALGYYTVGGNLARTATRETTAPLVQTIFPSFARIRDDPGRLVAAYQRAQAMITAIALPAGIGVATIAEPLIRLALGEKWKPAVFIVQWLAPVFALQTLGSLVQPLGMAKGETRLLFVRDTQMLLLRVPIILGAMLLYGMPGVIFGRVFTGLLNASMNLLLVKRFIGVGVLEQLSANARALVSVALMAAGVALASSGLPATADKFVLTLHLALLAVLGALLYCGTTYLLWMLMKRPAGPEAEVRTILGKILRKARFA